MGRLFRKMKTVVRANERNYPFIVQIAVPDGGFGAALGAINAWHRYSKNRQRPGTRQRIGEQDWWRWCFESAAIAEKFQQRFGGEIVHSPVERRTVDRAERPNVLDADLPECSQGAAPPE
jgi:hypothetical protein